MGRADLCKGLEGLRGGVTVRGEAVGRADLCEGLEGLGGEGGQ